MTTPARRLAKAITTRATPPETPYRTGRVAAVNSSSGTVDMELTSEDGSIVVVPGVRFHGGATPQVGRQVTYAMNGTEPIVLGESGSVHDPVFDGRVTARSFLAVGGENLLGDTQNRWPWEGWTASAPFSTESGKFVVARPGTDWVTITSPLIHIPTPGRHHTVWVEMDDAGANAYAWLLVTALDATGIVVQTWGTPGESVRVQNQPSRHYLVPNANFVVGDDVASLQITVIVLADAPAGNVTMNEAFVGTAPIFEGGGISIGRTQLDAGGIRFDGEDYLAAWYDATYVSQRSLGGGDWVVRHRRAGRTVFFNAFGTVKNHPAPSSAYRDMCDLSLPYEAKSRAVFVGHVGGAGDTATQYNVTAYVLAGQSQIGGIINGGWSGSYGYMTPTDPQYIDTGFQFHFSGVYESA